MPTAPSLKLLLTLEEAAVKRLTRSHDTLHNQHENLEVVKEAAIIDQKMASSQSEAGEISTIENVTKTLSSKVIREAWPAAEKHAEEVASIRESRGRDREDLKKFVKQKYQKIVTPESRLNLAALLRRAVWLFNKHLKENPQAAEGYMQVHSYQSHRRFPDTPIRQVPSLESLRSIVWSRGMLIYVDASKRAAKICIVVAAAPVGGGGTFKTSEKNEKGETQEVESPCWGQEEQVFPQIPGLFIAIHGGFTTRENRIELGSHIDTHPVMVENVVPLAKLGSGAVTTKRPLKPKDRELNDDDYGTSVFHASERQFKPEKALVEVKGGKPVNALFFSFADMRERKELGLKDESALVYTTDDLRDVITSAGTAITLFDRNADPEEELHFIGVGTGIYEHAPTISILAIVFMLAVHGRKGVYYGSEGAFKAAQAMLENICQTLHEMKGQGLPLTMETFVQVLHQKIAGLPDEQKLHWRIGGFRQPQERKTERGIWQSPPSGDRQRMKYQLVPPIPETP